VNIEYDTVSFFTKNYADQEPVGVFNNKKGVCAGYANLYKYLCDQLQLHCEIVSGYSKGYGFDDQHRVKPEVDHAWNVVEIYQHKYLIESTWGAGNLTNTKQFQRALSVYYFLPRPEQMIYHHLPEDEQWQLLKHPITIEQFSCMPLLKPEYFKFNLKLVQPKNQYFVDLEAEKAYALVIIEAPSHVQLSCSLKLDDEIIEGASQVVFSKVQRCHHCFFAPATVGKHKASMLNTTRLIKKRLNVHWS
jgi:transglutaminase/protease-like cytokinesis protein 3